jgi:hypothetical protein
VQAVEQHFPEATMNFCRSGGGLPPCAELVVKAKKTGGEIVLHLEQNPDILVTAARKGIGRW